MNGIRFVHTDCLRLAESVSGLAFAPSWLRRLARDSTRSAVSRVFEIAKSRNADFLFIGGSCTDSGDFQWSVRDWLEKRIRSLREQGIKVVMAASNASAAECLADVVLNTGECLHASRCRGQVSLTNRRTDAPEASELVVSPESAGPLSDVPCNYLFHTQTRYTARAQQHGLTVYAAGVPQSHGPHEQGESGCLVVDADPDTGRLDTVFEPTDPLRFETHRIKPPSSASSQTICEMVIEESRTLARQQRRTTVVDWQVATPVDCPGEIESWRQDAILESVRSILQQGHIGVWPRSIELMPSSVPFVEGPDSKAIRVLRSLIFEQPGESHQESDNIFAELITGTRLLYGAA